MIYRNREWLYEQYVEREMSEYDISVLAECSRSTVHHWLVKFGIDRRSKSEAISLANQKEHTPLPPTWDNAIPPVYVRPRTPGRSHQCKTCKYYKACIALEAKSPYIPLMCQAITFDDVVRIWNDNPTLLIETLRRYYLSDGTQ